MVYPRLRLWGVLVLALASVLLGAGSLRTARADPPPPGSFHIPPSYFTYDSSGRKSDVINVIVYSENSKQFDFTYYMYNLDDQPPYWTFDTPVSEQDFDAGDGHGRHEQDYAITNNFNPFANPRNHARFWFYEGDGHTAYFAASIEQPCLGTGHCLVPNGFNLGRDGGDGQEGMAPLIARYFRDQGIPYTWYVLHDPGTAGFTHPPQSNGAVATADGNIAVFCADVLRDDFCAHPQPAQGITLCQDINMTGRCQTFTGSVTNLTGSFVGNDQASSAWAAPGLTASIYTDADFKGDCEGVLPGERIDILYDFIRGHASSVLVGGDCLQPNSVKLCRDINYNGGCGDFSGNVAYVGNAWNDQASSVIFGPNVQKVALFFDANYGGPCLELFGNTPDLTGFSLPTSPTHSWNDVISALKVNGDCPSGGPAPGASNYHGHWVGDSYDGKPLTSITLFSGDRSDQIFVQFHNDGPATWDSNTVLLAWDPSTQNPYDYVVADNFCDPTGPDGKQDWQQCSAPGIPAWVGYGQVGPGGTATFYFYIQAPVLRTTTTYRLYFRPAQRINGQYYWINQPNGQATYEYFDVTVQGSCAAAVLDRTTARAASADGGAALTLSADSDTTNRCVP
jgi:hypothetical protein